MNVQDPPQGGGEHAFQETLSFDALDALSDEPAALARGSTVDRYVILEQVGGGAMGVVYAAYDPRLDRRVALKFLRQRPDRDIRQQRLVREAQAMARLSHPNVAVVYEVGAVGDHVFVAMEFVDGVDLRAWLRAASRSRAAIVELFIAVGRGLAAAHAAGIVHRDFKPENVLVDRQGRARVTDFGIARMSREGEAQAGRRPELAADAALPDGSSRSLTATGAVLGTPSYMAPEQHRGIEADARADQFAFCVALYEAVTGLRPFRGSSSAELLDAILTRRRTESEMPRWLRAALLRGLEPDPRDRWPDMDALLAALARRHDQRRRRWFLGGALAAGLGVLAWSWLAESRQIEECPPAHDRVAGIWAAPVRERVRAAFLATAAPGAQAVFERADRALQHRVKSWVDAHRDACRATRVSGEQSEALLDLRMQCLERARRQIAALPALWHEQVNLGEAVRAALTVGELEACGEADSLTAAVPAPRDPEGVRRLESLRRELDRVAALQRAGRLADALAPAREAIARARKLGYPPILAEALHRGGQLEIDSGDLEVGLALLHEAFRAASEAHDDARAATAMRLVLYYSATSSSHLAEADVLSKVAEAAVARVPRQDDLMADLLGTQGVVAQLQNNRALAIERLRRALALKEKLHGPRDFQILPVLNNLSAVLIDSDAVDEALALNERSRRLLEETLGPEHPLVVTSLQNRALVLLQKGDYAAASRSSERALDLVQKINVAEYPAMTRGLRNLAIVRKAQYRDDEARTLLERARQIALRARAADSWTLMAIDRDLAELALRRDDVALARRLMEDLLRREASGQGQDGQVARLITRGAIALRDGRAEAARAAYQQALALARAQGEDPLEVAAATSGLGEVALLEGRTGEAISDLERAARPIEARPGGSMHPFLVPILTDLGRAQLAADRPAQAIAALERAVAIADADRSSARTPGARARFTLAKALWISRDRARALALATAARGELAGHADVGEVDGWIRRRTGRPVSGETR